MKTESTDEKLLAFIREVPAPTAKSRPIAKKTWPEIVGTSVGDEADQEAARLGEEWRRSEGMVG